MYKALVIVEKVIEDSRLWNEAGDDFLPTFFQLSGHTTK